jgi:hypothetical protein
MCDRGHLKNRADDHSVTFPSETMPNGKSFPAKRVTGVQAVLDEMCLRNGQPWKPGEEEKMRKEVAQHLSDGDCDNVH